MQPLLTPERAEKVARLVATEFEFELPEDGSVRLERWKDFETQAHVRIVEPFIHEQLRSLTLKTAPPARNIATRLFSVPETNPDPTAEDTGHHVVDVREMYETMRLAGYQPACLHVLLTFTELHCETLRMFLPSFALFAMSPRSGLDLPRPEETNSGWILEWSPHGTTVRTGNWYVPQQLLALPNPHFQYFLGERVIAA